MAGELRIGLLHSDGELSQSIAEQRLGAQLAAAFTRETLVSGADAPVLIERRVTTETDVPAAARELVSGQGCALLLGAFSVPMSICAAQWAETAGVLYATANNNPLVGGGRRHVFHIGVPSEVTGDAVGRFLAGERGARRVGLLHGGNEFQVYAAACTLAPLQNRGAEVLQRELEATGAGDRAVLEQLRDWRAEAIMVYESDVPRILRLVETAHGVGGLPPFVYGRGVLCREFRDAAATAAEGHFFVDMYLRSDRAPAEEQALRQQLAARDPGLVATASHAFGWDEMRLLAAAWWAGGSNVEKQIAFLEGLRGYQGAGGPLTFAERDHQGRWTQDPTTITRLSGGQFVVISTLDR